MSLSSAQRVLGGRYRLIREIARGGMAAVWEAQDALLDRRVAIKLLHPHYADDPEFLERFQREARAAARLSHPNIVPIYDVGEDADAHAPYIVMELVVGGSLKDRIRRFAPLPDREIRAVGATLAATLDYAHRKGLIHRDVKPQNVLLGEDGRPRLTDFGIAEAIASSGLTRTGAVMGSIHYIAPELVRGQKAVPQSDVYSLGAVMYEMATGRVPFLGETDVAIALAHVEETPAAPRALNARLALDLERVILRSLAKSPEQRFMSAGQLAAELRDGTPETAQPTRQRAAAAPTQRIPTVAVAPGPKLARRAASPPAATGGTFARRTARPRPGRGPGAGVLSLLLTMAAVLVALGAGFFGLATLSREGIVPPEPTPPPTAAPKPAAVPTSTPLPAPRPTSEATPTPQPSPLPTPSPLPPSPTPQPQPRAIPVPQLRGKTLDAAQTALRSDGLTTTVKGVNVNVDKDVVADQSPDVGTTLPPGGTVTIMVGTGSTSIPAVTNLPRDQAVTTLQNSSFHVTPRDRRDSRIPAGIAIATNPPAGTILPRGSAIVLDVSSGR